MAEFESNAVLANRIAELQRENSKLQSEIEAFKSLYSAAKGSADKLNEMLRGAKEERDALVATVEALRKVLDYADNKLYILTHNRNDVSQRLLGDADKAFKVVRDAISQSATPHQHLRDVLAKAGRAGFIAGVEARRIALLNDEQAAIKADEYAERVKDGEK